MPQSSTKQDSQSDLQIREIKLPDLIIGPIKYPIGEARQLLRLASTYSILEISKIKISPRISEDCYKLDNDEQIIVTHRRKIELPGGVQGALRVLDDGSYVWITHRLLEERYKQIEDDGLCAVASFASSTWSNAFNYRADQLDDHGVVIPGKEGLRPPQLGALFSIGAHWSLHNNPATIVMPTGTGKTETMLSTLAAFDCAPQVVAVPTEALREQTANKFLNFGLLRHLNVLADTASNPVVGVIKHRPKTIDDLTIFEDCNVVVGTMSSLSGGTAAKLSTEIAKRSGTLILDEAHHVAASTWSQFRTAFTNNRVLQFTATPFRRDGKLVDGDIIYSYPLKAAQEDGYFKKITFDPVHELSSDSVDITIAEAAIAQLRQDLSDGHNHLVMARCSSVSKAENVQRIYEELAPECYPLLIYSELKGNSERLLALREGKSRIVVCVDMLGEGVDLPELKIAAVHDTHKSLSVLLQFTGRFTRSSGQKLGDATVIANTADPDVSIALERLYSEDSDWNSVLNELSSNAAKEHAELIQFLNDSISLGEEDSELPSISHHLLRPKLSTLFFRCTDFYPKRFYEGLPPGYQVIRIWINEHSNTLFFVTRSTEKVIWSRSKELFETGWDLFIVHHDKERQLLYLNSSEKGSNFEKIARSVGATEQISGEQIFRCLGRIGRLVFQNLGVSKHGRRNLSYAMYTGSDVRQALSLSEKSGSRKSNLSGNGWEDRKQITIGCSYKGRVWSRETGTIPKFVSWAESVGDKLVDDTIKTEEIIDNVLIPDEIERLPDVEVLSIEWPLELLRHSEEKLLLERSDESKPFYLFDLQFQRVEKENNKIFFMLVSAEEEIWCEFELRVGVERGFSVLGITDQTITLMIGRHPVSIVEFFNDYPPLVRYVDLSELDGNLILRPQNPKELELSNERFEVWDWTGTDLQKESLWKDNNVREDSIQWTAAQHFIKGGFSTVFDDDGAGEAADLVCLNEEDDYISLALVHCKYSSGGDVGIRIKDVVEVASQAIRSAKWPGRFRELCKHLLNRNEKRKTDARPSQFLRGEASDITRISRAARFKEVRTQILIVQPGLSQSKVSNDQSQVLAAAVIYLKETIGIDLDIICSD